MNYVTGSNGQYIVALSRAIAFKNGKSYVAFIDADASSGGPEAWGHWEVALKAKARTE